MESTAASESTEPMETIEENDQKPERTEPKLAFSIENLLADKFTETPSTERIFHNHQFVPETAHFTPENKQLQFRNDPNKDGQIETQEVVAANHNFDVSQSEGDDDDEVADDNASVNSSEHVDVESGPGGEMPELETSFSQAGNLSM